MAVSVKDYDAIRGVADLGIALDGPNVLRYLYTAMIHSIMLSFENEAHMDVHGNVYDLWVSLADATVENRRAYIEAGVDYRGIPIGDIEPSRPILYVTGTMFNDLMSDEVYWFQKNPKGYTLEYIPSVEYAHIHQYGDVAGTIPARPFLDEDEEEDSYVSVAEEYAEVIVDRINAGLSIDYFRPMPEVHGIEAPF